MKIQTNLFDYELPAKSHENEFSVEYKKVIAHLKEKGIYLAEKKIGKFGLIWLENVDHKEVLERLEAFEVKHKEQNPHDETKRFFVGNPVPTKSKYSKFSRKELMKLGCFGLYIMRYREDLRGMENQERLYI